MTVLIAGGGIGGLTLALSLHQIGVPVRVFESVAELLWSGVWSEDPASWNVGPSQDSLDKIVRLASVDVGQPDVVKLFSLLVMSMAARDSGGDDLREGNTIVAARNLLTLLPGCMGYLTAASRYAGAMAPAARTGHLLAERILRCSGLKAEPGAIKAVAIDALSVADWLAERLPDGADGRLGRYLAAYTTAEFGLDTGEQSALGLVYDLASSTPTELLPDSGGADERWHVSASVRATAVGPGGTGLCVWLH